MENQAGGEPATDESKEFEFIVEIQESNSNTRRSGSPFTGSKVEDQ